MDLDIFSFLIMLRVAYFYSLLIFQSRRKNYLIIFPSETIIISRFSDDQSITFHKRLLKILLH